jgi:hypothetical protein
MILPLSAGLLGGCIAFPVLLAHFGPFIALLGSQFSASVAALGAGALVAWRRAEARPRIEHDEMIDTLRRLSEKARRKDSLAESAPKKQTA